MLFVRESALPIKVLQLILRPLVILSKWLTRAKTPTIDRLKWQGLEMIDGEILLRERFGQVRRGC